VTRWRSDIQRLPQHLPEKGRHRPFHVIAARGNSATVAQRPRGVRFLRKLEKIIDVMCKYPD
jgi:hypothetical protein